MDVSAAVTSKGQVTIPREVRDALGLREGDRAVFRVVVGGAVLARTAECVADGARRERPGTPSHR